MDVKRVQVTKAAEDMIKHLEKIHGPLMFHQSGGCCDGSSPMCYPRDDFKLGDSDVFLGNIADTPFYMSGSQFEYWKHTKLTIDLVKGRGSGFSVESPEGVRFLTRSELFTDEEAAQLEKNGAPLTGTQH